MRMIVTMAALWVGGALAAEEPASLEKVRYADGLDAALSEASAGLLADMKADGIRTVGVLKFMARNGKSRPTDNAGTLNESLASRLELALILTNDPAAPVGVIRNPGVIAAKYGFATHLDPDGRSDFFLPKYELAWGEGEEVKAERFLTGTATFSPDLKTLGVVISSFDASGEENVEAAKFEVPVTPRILAEAGYSYLLTPENAPELFQDTEGARGPKRSQLHEAVVNAAPKPNVSPDEPVVYVTPPEEAAPVKLQIRYDDRPVPITDGHVPEPTEQAKVTFVLHNTSARTQAVVLKVNGQNTLFREELPELLCHKWILEPGTKVMVPGFQEDFERTNPFRVLAPEASRDNEVNYGPHVGTFQMAVFTGSEVEGEPENPVPDFSDDELALAAISRGSSSFPSAKSGSLEALQAKLRNRNTDGTGGRGLIVADENRVDKQVKQVYFKPDLDIPTYLLSVRYYLPKR